MISLAVITLLIILIFSGNTDSSALPGEEKSGTAWGFFVRKKALVFYLCYILPVTLLNGYRSYLFPIYSGSAGISAAMLSNIYVMARAGAFVASDTINTIGSKMKSRTLMLVSGIGCSVCFILFLISPNIWWAIAVLFISNILLRSSNTGSIYYQSELCEDLRYDAKKVSMGSETVKGIFGSASSPLRSFFLALGNNWACAVLGLVSTLLMSLFSLTAKRNKA